MTKRTLLLASLAPAMLLAACDGTQNRTLESVHQPVVSRSDYAFDVATDAGRLAPGENERLGGWLDAMRLGYGDRVAVDAPDDDPGTRAEIAGIVAVYGLLLADAAPVTSAPVTPGTVRVVVSRMSASVPTCPDWSREPGFDVESNTSSNFGCAANSNLAMMVARPEDLVRGQAGSSTIDPAVSAKAIDAYRKSTPTGAGGGLRAESARGK